jgi:outer membrane protein assembly factor BamB
MNGGKGAHHTQPTRLAHTLLATLPKGQIERLTKPTAMIPKQLKALIAFGAAASLSACGGQSISPVATTNNALPSQRAAEDTAGESVAYQINVEHTGFARGPLHLPLQQLWSHKLGGTYGGVQYPIIANGIIVVIANKRLMALDEKTGKKLWSHDPPNQYGWVGPAYDNGMVFASANVSSRRKAIGMFAFDERTGTKLWAARLLGGGSAPTAASGVVYTSAIGQLLYAYDESSGAVKWKAGVEGGESSPVVTTGGIFVSYACPWTYDFRPGNGTQIWRYANSSCGGGGGSTPVLYDGLLFVEDIYSIKYTGLILNAQNGTIAGNFNSTTIPAFAHKLGFFVNQSTLTAQSIPSMKQVWSTSVEASDGYETPPLVVGSIVYLTTITNTLVGYDVNTGKQKVDVELPASSFDQSYFGSLGFGDGELIVPDGSYLVASKGR